MTTEELNKELKRLNITAIDLLLVAMKMNEMSDKENEKILEEAKVMKIKKYSEGIRLGFKISDEERLIIAEWLDEYVDIIEGVKKAKEEIWEKIEKETSYYLDDDFCSMTYEGKGMKEALNIINKHLRNTLQ